MVIATKIFVSICWCGIQEGHTFIADLKLETQMFNSAAKVSGPIFSGAK